jgi:hypothetical protein
MNEMDAWGLGYRVNKKRQEGFFLKLVTLGFRVSGLGFR